MELYAKNRDPHSNTTRRLLLKNLSDMCTITKSNAPKFHISPKFVELIQTMTLDDILTHAKVYQGNHGLKNEIIQLVHRFYNRDDISRVVPHKNATVLVSTPDGEKQRVCLRVMEKTLEGAYKIFCAEHGTE